MNPFEAPRAAGELEVLASADSAETRRNHRTAEVRLRRAAGWFIALALLCVLVAVPNLAAFLRSGGTFTQSLPRIAVSAVLAAAYVGLAFRLWAYDGRFRLIAAITIMPLLALFPFGTWLGVRILHALLGRESAFLCSAEYARVRAETPELDLHSRYLTVPLVAIAVLVLGLTGAFAAIRMLEAR